MKAFFIPLIVALGAMIIPASASAGGGPSVNFSVDGDRLVVSVDFDGPITLTVNGTNVPTKFTVFVPPPFQPSGCPDGPLGHQMAATQVGGDANAWLREDSLTFPGTWKYRNKGNDSPLRYPGYGTLDVWIGGPTTISLANANLLNGKTFDEATLTC